MSVKSHTGVGSYIGSSGSFSSGGVFSLKEQQQFASQDLWKNDIITNGLILSLDSGNIASYPGTGSIWYDLSGNNTNATLVGSPTYSTTNGTSLVFNGSTQYATASMTNLRPTSGITQEVWFNISSSGVYIFIGAQFGAGSDNSYALWYEGGNWRAGVRLNNSFNYAGVTSPGFPTNTWTHFVHTFDGTNQIQYINGVAIETRNTPGTISAYDTNNTLLAIGTDWNSGYNGGPAGIVNGKMSIVRLYNRGLSASEVLTNYNAIRTRYGV